MGGPMRSGSAAVPDGSLAGGKVLKPPAVAETLRHLLARTEVTETRALVAVCDSIASFRVLALPADTTEREVDAAVARELPADADRLSTRWIDVADRSGERLIYAVAYDRAVFKNSVEAIRQAGLSASVVELKSASLARTVSESACIVLDLTADPVEIVLVDRHVPRLWHGFRLQTPLTDGSLPALAAPLRSVLRFHRRAGDTDFGPHAPILVSSEQDLPAHLLSALSELIGQPAQTLPPPARVPPELRHAAYLGCIGLLMRRTS